MNKHSIILPGKGRWQRVALTEGNRPTHRSSYPRIPSTILRMVPLPVPGRI